VHDQIISNHTKQINIKHTEHFYSNEHNNNFLQIPII